jgi:hypothetical protein
MVQPFKLLGHVVGNVPYRSPVLIIDLAIVPDLKQKQSNIGESPLQVAHNTTYTSHVTSKLFGYLILFRFQSFAHSP